MLDMLYLMLLVDVPQNSVGISILSNLSVIHEAFLRIRTSVLKFRGLKLFL